MGSQYIIDIDAPCLQCGYNLRTLPADHRCPECGSQVLASITSAISNSIPRNRSFRGDEAQEANRRILTPAASVSGLPVDLLLFVWDAVRFAMEDKPPRTGAGPAEVCDAVRSYAIEYFGDVEEAVAVLSALGVVGSEQIGEAVSILNRAGWLRGSEDVRAAYAGLFKLQDWAAARGLG